VRFFARPAQRRAQNDKAGGGSAAKIASRERFLTIVLRIVRLLSHLFSIIYDDEVVIALNCWHNSCFLGRAIMTVILVALDDERPKRAEVLPIYLGCATGRITRYPKPCSAT
jgi:hypothetical protein